MIDIRNATTATLLGTMRNLYRPSTFILDLAFPFEMTFDDELVLWDEVADSRKMATFTPPDMKANRNQAPGFTTKSATAPYIKEDGAIKPKRALKRRAGEALLGEQSPEERLAALALEDLLEYERKVLRAKEYMACALLNDGRVTLTGTNYDEPVTFDFGRDPSLSLTLTGAQRWGEPGVSVIDDIEEWAAQVQTICGVAPTTVVMSSTAWRKARKDEEFKEMLDNRRGGGTASIELGPISPDDVSHARFVGHAGDFEIWVYEQQVQAPDGTVLRLIPENNIWLLSPALEGVRSYGAVQTVDSMVPTSLFPRIYPEKNPDALIAEVNSAPLLVPLRVNATMRIKVA